MTGKIHVAFIQGIERLFSIGGETLENWAVPFVVELLVQELN